MSRRLARLSLIRLLLAVAWLACGVGHRPAAAAEFAHAPCPSHAAGPSAAEGIELAPAADAHAPGDAAAACCLWLAAAPPAEGVPERAAPPAPAPATLAASRQAPPPTPPPRG